MGQFYVRGASIEEKPSTPNWSIRPFPARMEKDCVGGKLATRDIARRNSSPIGAGAKKGRNCFPM